MSRIYAVVAILMLSGQTSFSFAGETPDANDFVEMLPLASIESMLISEPSVEQISKTQPEPSVAEQIEQIKYLLDWLYEVAETMDEDIWLNLTTSLEEMLKELEAD